MKTMKFNVFLRCGLLAAAVLPVLAWAQASGEAVETGPAAASERAVAVRSALWQAIEAHHRQRDVAPALPDRRLTSAERQELRSQVRRAWDRPETVPTAGEQSSMQR